MGSNNWNEKSSTVQNNRSSQLRFKADSEPETSTEPESKNLTFQQLDTIFKQNIDKYTRKYNKKFVDLSYEFDKKFINLNEELTKLTNDLDPNKKGSVSEKLTSDLDQKIQNSSSQSIALLAIFTTVFIFISVNITIFQKVKTGVEAVFFMTIIALLCAIIVSVPILILQAVNGSKINWKPIISIFLSGLLGLILIAWIALWSNFELTTCEDKQKNLIIPLP